MFRPARCRGSTILVVLARLAEVGGWGRIEGTVFWPDGPAVREEAQLRFFDEQYGGAEGGWPNDLYDRDARMVAVVRWLNERGLSTRR